MTKEEKVHDELVKLGQLEIDKEGHIWRIARFWKAGENLSGCVVKPTALRRAEFLIKSTGYLFVRMQRDGVVTVALAHRLVWYHFNGPIPIGLTINHINGVKTDNHPANLELATHQEQTLHALHVIKTRVARSGEKNGMARLTQADVAKIRKKIENGSKHKDVAEEFGVSRPTIGHVVHKRTWQ